MGTRTVIALACALAALCWWWSAGATQLPDSGGTAGAAAVLGDEAVGEGSSTSRSAVAESVESRRFDVTPGVCAESPCCVRLVGLLPSVPWRAPLQWCFRVGSEPRQELRAVDRLGFSWLVPPKGAGKLEQLSFRANDPAYRITSNWTRAELRVGDVLDVKVEPIGVVWGAVRGTHGKAIRARVRAFAWHRAKAQLGELLAATRAEADGSFALRVPARVDLRVVADVPLPQLRLESGAASDLVIDFPLDADWGASDRLAIQATLPTDPELVPASAAATCAHCESRELPTLFLRAAAELTGRLATVDGEPLANTLVFAYPAHRSAPGSCEQAHWLAAGGVVYGGRVRTDDEGRFTMALAPGVAFVISAVDERRKLLPHGPSVTAMAPGHVELIRR